MTVETWLTDLGLGHYAQSFADNGVDPSLLPELTNEDLKDLGVERLADRKTILKAIEGLSADDPAPAAETALSGERRQVTVLFADLAGYTKLSSELGAEETHGLLNRYFEAVDGVVEHYGGAIDKHMGDNVMALFGAPIAHDDDPLRALRAALDIHQKMVALSDQAGHRLSAHIGIASGQVVASGTGSDAHREYTVTGDSVNLASRLQDKAAPGETLISDAVYRTVAERVGCQSLGDVAVKGLAAPIRVWRVGALNVADESRAAVAFVGRRAEIAQFAGVLEACRANGAGQAVVVRGEAGIGKTRLVEEFVRAASARGYRSHRGLVLDFGVGKGQDAIRSVVRSLLGLASGAGEAARQAALAAALEGGRIGADQRVFLTDLLDLAQPTDDRALYDAMDNAARNDGKRAIVDTLIRGASADSPIVVTIEDVHWADPLLLGHLASLASSVADCPALLVMTSRIEGDPLDPAWRATTGGCPLMTIDLGPLRRTEAMTLAGAFIDATQQFTQDCIERAAGNPLFLEQLLRNAEERGDEEVPASIQSLVLARMDRLLPGDKRALQAASVIGQRFALDLLRHLLDDSAYSCAGLLEHHLVRPEDDGLLFAHALIRDGVYASLLTATRQALHVRAADWFGDRDLVLRAEHLDRADQEDAPGAYLQAAQGQAALYHYDRALDLVERGRHLAARPEDRFALTSFKAKLLHDMGSIAESLEASRGALKLAGSGEQRCEALIALARCMRISDQFDEAFAALEEAERLAAEGGHNLLRARIHDLRGNLFFPLGRIEACLREHNNSLKFAQESTSLEAQAQALSGLGDAEYARGRMATAYDAFTRCVALCREHGFGQIEVGAVGMVAHSGIYLDGPRTAVSECRAAIQAAQRVGHRRAEMNAHLSTFFSLVDLDRLDQAEPHFARGEELVRQLGAWRFQSAVLTWRGRALVQRGRGAEALEVLRRALEISLEVGVGFDGPRIVSVLALATDDPEERRWALAEGARYLAKGSVGHNHFWYFRDAIDVMLKQGDWAGAESYATALEDFTRPEPLVWSNLFIARGRALAAHGRGQGDLAQELKRLCDEAERLGLICALPALQAALADGESPLGAKAPE